MSNTTLIKLIIIRKFVNQYNSDDYVYVTVICVKCIMPKFLHLLKTEYQL